MIRSYDELLGDRDHTVLGYRNDYTPCAPLLAQYSGRILDVGGGNGIARHFLIPGVKYGALEPSLEWLDPRWRAMAGEFPCLAEPFDFVRGAAEHLPFRDESFDGVLLLWSLNHVSEPNRTLREMARVLRRGGRTLIVLEDMPPRWLDFLHGGYPHDGNQRWRALVLKLRSVLLGWPLQPDHVRIRERDLLSWAAPQFDVALRAWLGAYLTFELVKKDAGR
jgi:SAM-dependent methyltransferase